MRLFFPMQRAQMAIIASLITTSAIAWVASIQQPNMMAAMMTYDPVAIALFTASWTAGMAAMMFPAISPMVLLYNRFVTAGGKNDEQSSVLVQQESKPRSSIQSLRVVLFTGCYLLVWALTGIALLLGWSVVMNSTIMTAGNYSQLLTTIYGSLLIAAGVYQFTPLKKTCIGYCESPLSFFMRRWSGGTSGAVKMGLYHGMYCLGCCWAYFLLMVALGWMNLLWMGLFAGIIFGEKIWRKGIWIARAAGIGLVAAGILVIAGFLPSLVSDASMINNNQKEEEGTNMQMDNQAGSREVTMTFNDDASSSMDMSSSDDSVVAPADDEMKSDDTQSMLQSVESDSDTDQEMAYMITK